MARSLLLRTLPVLLLAALLLTPATAGARSAPYAQVAVRCSGGDLVPTADNVDAVRATMTCLHNQIRSVYHLPLLTENSRLRRAAVGHSVDMVANRYFDHTAPSGTTLVDRLLGANSYVGRSSTWVLGENIAWGAGTEASAASIMTAWMNSSDHRANILRRSYREVGVGITAGVPTEGSSGATYTADFGARD